MSSFYYKKEVSRLTDIPPRKIQFYTENVGIIPDVHIPEEKGSNRKYSRENLIEFLLVKELTGMGLQLAIIEEIMKRIIKAKKTAQKWWTDRVIRKPSWEIVYCLIYDPFIPEKREIQFRHMDSGGGHRFATDGTPLTFHKYMREDEGVRMVITLNISKILEEVMAKTTI